MKNYPSLVAYGDKIQIGAVDMDNNLIPMPKFETEELDPENQSLKSFLDSILPPKKIEENGLIFYHFVSCDSAIVNDVIKLNKELENQLKLRGAKEKGVDRVREEIFNECFDEIIRQVTVSCLQRGDLLNRIKIQMKCEIQYYQNLYESIISFSLRKVLQEKKKKKKLDKKKEDLEKEIRDLEQEIINKEKMMEDMKRQEEEKEKRAKEEHKKKMENFVSAIEENTQKITTILTTPQNDVGGIGY